MLKKALALALAAVMLLMPMTASAVTWNQLVTGLRTSSTGSYTSDDGETTITRQVEDMGNQKATIIVVRGGNIDFEDRYAICAYDDNAYQQYILDGIQSDYIHVDGADGQRVVVVVGNESKVGDLFGYAKGNQSVVLANEGTVDGMSLYVEYGGTGTVSNNNGTVTGYMTATAVDGSSATVMNHAGSVNNLGGFAEGGNITVVNEENGTVNQMNSSAYDGGALTSENQGTVTSFMSTSAEGEDSTVSAVNNGTVEGSMSTRADDGAAGEAVNTGTVGGSLGVSAYDGGAMRLENSGTAEYSYARGEDGDVSTVNNGSMGEFYATVQGSATNTVENNGTIDFAIADSYDDGKVTFSGDGKVNNSMVYINVPSTETYTASQIQEILNAVNLPNAGTELYTMDENGEFTARYEITEDGQLVLVEVFGEEEHEIPVEPDPVEEQRQLEGIGGVTTSPVWNWQGYLGHSSKPMWIYVNGEKTLMRQRLFWLGDSTKNHTCRINAAEPDPASVELRVGLDMLRTAERAEISVISILDSENNPVAQFAVSDLLAAFEQYGLVEGELLCVSADADAEVMKVTLDGAYLPLEEKAE